jgi:hypothetical protein
MLVAALVPRAAAAQELGAQQRGLSAYGRRLHSERALSAYGRRLQGAERTLSAYGRRLNAYGRRLSSEEQ